MQGQCSNLPPPMPSHQPANYCQLAVYFLRCQWGSGLLVVTVWGKNDVQQRVIIILCDYETSVP